MRSTAGKFLSLGYIPLWFRRAPDVSAYALGGEGRVGEALESRRTSDRNGVAYRIGE
jgi:hypothetical protein